MREQHSGNNLASKPPQTQPTTGGQENAVLVAGTSPLAHLSEQGAGAEAHASILKRASLKPSRSSGFQTSPYLLSLQRQYGNRYLQRVVALAGQEEGEGQVAPPVESAIESACGGGQALEDGTRLKMESAIGADFSDVRIHTDTQAHSLSEAVNAVAFTTGKDIFFRQGTYNPKSTDGRQLLAHELTHVVQQNGGSVASAQGASVQRMCSECMEEERQGKIQTKLAIGQVDDQYEQEADQVAQRVIQRWPFSDDEDDSSGGGVLNWVEQKASAATNAVSEAAGGAADWAKKEGGAAVDAVTDAGSGAVDWVKKEAGAAVDAGSGAVDWVKKEAGAAVDAGSGAVDWVKKEAGAAVDAATDAGSGAVDWVKKEAGAAVDAGSEAVDWVKAKGGELASAAIEQTRLSVLGQISGALQKLGGLQSLPISEGDLSTLNGHLASLRDQSNGLINVGGISAESSADSAQGADKSVDSSTIGGLLSSLQSALSKPAASSTNSSAAGSGAVQRKIQRFVMDPATAAALAAAAAAAEGVAEGGAPIAVVAAPETGGISLAVLAVVAVIVAIIVGIIVYASTRPDTPPPQVEPKMPEGLSREKKEKWKKCQGLYETYKKGTGTDVGSLASEIKALRGRYDSLTPQEKLELCAKVHQQIDLVERLINERRSYIDNGCDEFDWFEQGKSESDRRNAHEGEVDNVKAQEGNLRGLLKRLQDEGVC